MSHQVVWTKRVTDFFVSAANLTELERGVLESRIAGMTRIQIAMYYNISLRTEDKIVSRLKHLYDIVQQEYPDELKPRRMSAEELYQDTH